VARPRVLIIDDDADLRQTLQMRFTAAGFEVFQAGNGKDGIELARDKHPFAIILDVNMPGINGFETCRRLRADPKTQNIPVLMLTTCTRVGELEEGLRSGADTYLRKPFAGPELVAEVRELAAVRAGRKKSSAKPAKSTKTPSRDEAVARIAQLMAAAPRRLGDVARAAPGVLLSQQDDRLLTDAPVSSEHRSILFEEDVQAFAARKPRKYLRFSESVARSLAPDPSIFDEPRKILLRRTAPPLVAALDEDRRLADKAVICVAPLAGRVKAEFLLGVLASRLGGFAFERVIARSRGGTLPWASALEIERLPLPGPGGLAGLEYEGLVAEAAAEIVRHARVGPGWRTGSALGLLEQLDALVARGFGLGPELLKPAGL